MALLLTIAGCAAWLAVVPPAAAKEFSIDAMVVEATVSPEGDMKVVEHLTYEFDGVFNVGDRDIPASPDYLVVDMTASEGGQPRPTVNPDPASFEWDLGGATGRHTYEIAYTVIGVVDVGPDVGELYWKFIGDDFPSVGRLDVTITFPGDGEDLRAWAHGPLNGRVHPVGNTVTLDVDDVPANEFVEARVTYPAENYTVEPTGGPRLDRVLEEETERAEQANEERQRRKLAQVVSPVLTIAGLGVFAAIWVRWGKEPAPPPDVGEYWRDIPQDSPATLLALDKFGSGEDGAVAATIVDLAQRGWLTIEEQPRARLPGRDAVEYVFTSSASAAGRPKGQGGVLTDYERLVLERLFDNRSAVTQSDLLKEAKSNPSEAAAWMDSFKEGVKREFDAKGYVEGRRFVPYSLNWLTALVVGGVGAIAFFGLRALFGVAGMVGAATILAATPLLRRRTQLGARRKAEAEGLRRFLHDFSRVNEVPVGHLALYERYLVYAVALGVADELLEGLRMRVPEMVDQGSGFAGWYIGSSNHGGFDGGSESGFGGLTSISTFASEMSSNLSSAFSPPSSSSGGGGGFSGGGGGGGGGGGAGAH